MSNVAYTFAVCLTASARAVCYKNYTMHITNINHIEETDRNRRPPAHQTNPAWWTDRQRFLPATRCAGKKKVQQGYVIKTGPATIPMPGGDEPWKGRKKK